MPPGKKGDLWEAELPGSASAQIVHAGKPLAQRSQVFWKVQVVDGKQRRSSWSRPARWSTGLLDSDAWTAKWIDDLVDGQKADGAFTDVAPVVITGWSPGWGDAGVIVPWTLWNVYGDTRTLGRNYDALKRYMDYLQKRAPESIGPNHGYADWLAIGGSTAPPSSRRPIWLTTRSCWPTSPAP